MSLFFGITGQGVYLDTNGVRPSFVESVEVFCSTAGDDSPIAAAISGGGLVEVNPDTTLVGPVDRKSSNPNRIYVEDSTGIEVGRTYRLTNGYDESEMVEVIAASGTTVDIRHGVRNSYEVGSTLQTTRIYVDIDDDWIRDENNISDDLDPNPGYRVRWMYLVGDEAVVDATYFDVSRYKSRHSVTPEMVATKRTSWINNLPEEHHSDRGQSLIDSAYDEVSFDLFNASLPEEMVRNREVINQLVIRKAILLATEDRVSSGGDDITALEIDTIRYQSLLDGFAQNVGKVQTASGKSGAADSIPNRDIWGK